MIHVGAARKAAPFVLGHLRAALGTATLALAFMTWLHFDRAPPFEYVSTDITPSPAVEGSMVTVSRNVIWNRNCDGEIFREVVKPGGQIVLYDRMYRPFPYRLGRQSAQSSFDLPTIMLSPDISKGSAIYRGRVRFTQCGLTSRLMPIEIPFQEVTFEVMRR
jgi:hypothetical protein